MKFLILVFILLFSVYLEAKTSQKVYKVGVLKDWKPYYFLDQNKKPTGYAVDLFEKLASNLDIKYEYVIVESWKELNNLLKLQKIDIIPNIGIALKRADYTNFTQSTDVFEIGLFKHKNLHDIKSLEDVKTRSVAVCKQV